jgi:hypothetical protein
MGYAGNYKIEFLQWCVDLAPRLIFGWKSGANAAFGREGHFVDPRCKESLFVTTTDRWGDGHLYYLISPCSFPCSDYVILCVN